MIYFLGHPVRVKISYGELALRTLAFLVYDQDRLSSDEFIGQVYYPLWQFEAGQVRDEWRQIEKSSDAILQVQSTAFSFTSSFSSVPILCLSDTWVQPLVFRNENISTLTFCRHGDDTTF